MDAIVTEAQARKMQELPRKQQAALAMACAERLWPAYEAFCRESGWDHAGQLRVYADRIWQIAAGGSAELPLPLEWSIEITPPGNEFDSIYTTAAQGVAICVGSAANLLLTNDQSTEFLEYVFEALESLTPEMVAGELLVSGSDESQRFEKTFMASAPLKSELASQDADLAVLISQKPIEIRVDQIRRDAKQRQLRP
jgi:uncharacterized protein YjaG (DUF416 family)